MNSFDKHFLDSSILQSLLLASSAYRAYLKGILAGGSCYISKYVAMEFRRSYLANGIAFYFVLKMSQIESIADALAVWSNKFKDSELKAIMRAVSQLLEDQKLDFNRIRDKETGLFVLASYIRRLALKLKQFKDIGVNGTGCTRATVPFEVNPEEPAKGLTSFAKAFNDIDQRRKECHIDCFLLDRFSSQSHTFVKLAADLSNSQENRGFKVIAEKLERILQEGPSVCSCRMCEGIGDAVITLETPRYMLLEHTDYSFNHLCPPLQQPHRQHKSEVAFLSHKNV